MLQRPAPIAVVQLRNPIQPSEFVDDGQIVVDVIATDASGEVFQVEMQSWNHAALKERILYAWATLYKAQLEKGDKYTELRPVVSIWLMDQNTFRGATGFHHRFRVRDDDGLLELSSHLELHVLELDRWRQHPDLATPAGLLGWRRFLTEAETWREVPPDIETPVLESAMSVLTEFQTNAARNDLYRSRLDYLRVQNTMAADFEQALADRQQALADRDRALADKDRALADKQQALVDTQQALVDTQQALAREAQLRERLRAAGIDPDAE